MTRAGWSVSESEAYDRYLNRMRRKKALAAYGQTASTDSQMNKLYDAETQYMKGREFVTFKTLPQVRAFVEWVMKSKTFQSEVKRRTKNFSVYTRKANSYLACASPDQLVVSEHWLKEGHINDYVILHELAHVAGHLHHDVGFRQCLIKLVSKFLGVEEAKALKAEFKKAKLKISYGNLQTKSQNEWRKSYNKMKAMRAKRDDKETTKQRTEKQQLSKQLPGLS